MLRRRRKDERASNDDDNVTIASEENAWWASRDEFDSDRVPRGRTKKKVVPPLEDRNTFKAYFSSDSLLDSTAADATGIFDETDPYVFLGLPPPAPGKNIAAPH